MEASWRKDVHLLFFILTLLLSLLHIIECEESSHPPWHTRLKDVSRMKAPLLGMDNKDRILTDFFVLIDKKKVRQATKDECVQNFLEHLKTKITKNTDYYDIKRVCNDFKYPSWSNTPHPNLKHEFLQNSYFYVNFSAYAC